MALTAEQENQLEYATASSALNNAEQVKQRKLELVRIAKEVLVENARSKAVGERDVAAADITSYADTLNTYINS